MSVGNRPALAGGKACGQLPVDALPRPRRSGFSLFASFSLFWLGLRASNDSDRSRHCLNKQRMVGPYDLQEGLEPHIRLSQHGSRIKCGVGPHGSLRPAEPTGCDSARSLAEMTPVRLGVAE